MSLTIIGKNIGGNCHDIQMNDPIISYTLISNRHNRHNNRNFCCGDREKVVCMCLFLRLCISIVNCKMTSLEQLGVTEFSAGE